MSVTQYQILRNVFLWICCFVLESFILEMMLENWTNEIFSNLFNNNHVYPPNTLLMIFYNKPSVLYSIHTICKYVIKQSTVFGKYILYKPLCFLEYERRIL